MKPKKSNNRLQLIYSARQGNFRDDYYTDGKGNSFRVSFYLPSGRFFSAAPVDLEPTIPKYGNF